MMAQVLVENPANQQEMTLKGEAKRLKTRQALEGRGIRPQ